MEEGAMPKEVIYDQAELWDVHVGWRTDSDVQVGVVTHDGRSIAETLRAGEDDPADFASLWGSLDRAGINRLIKILRHARDQAYGRDE
jgi:hypothetical protein